MKILNKSALLLAMGLLTACGGSSGSGSGSDSKPSLNDTLEGSWIGSCEYLPSLSTYYQNDFVFKGDEITEHLYFHSFSDCSDEGETWEGLEPYTRKYSLGDEVTTESGLTANKLNLTDLEENITKYTLIKLEDVGDTRRISFGANSSGSINDGSTEERRYNKLVSNTYYHKK